MNTKLIGTKDFRQNTATLPKTAKEEKQLIVVMNRNKPTFAITPSTEQDNLGSLVADITASRPDAAAGRTCSHAQMMTEFAPE